jgi:hypothetical protein
MLNNSRVKVMDIFICNLIRNEKGKKNEWINGNDDLNVIHFLLDLCLIKILNFH